MPRGQRAASTRAELAERVRAHRREIEQATFARIDAVDGPGKKEDPTYLDGLRAAVSAALDLGLAAIESEGRRAPEIPVVLLAQARLAARGGVALDTVLRRYFAGYTILGDFLVAEAAGFLGREELQATLRSQAACFDRVIAAVSAEHGRETEERADARNRYRPMLVRRLLSGELLETGELDYDFNAFHLGLVASGSAATEILRGLAKTLDCRLLAVCPDERTTWAWLGSRRCPDLQATEQALSALPRSGVAIAAGEPGQRLSGWRLTHRQAAAALPIAQSRSCAVRYGNVALLAATLHDDLLRTSLQQMYLQPLEVERDGGETLRETLRAYFAAERNSTSTAAALGINRNTVSSRLRTIEGRIGRPLASSAVELETALGLHDCRSK